METRLRDKRQLWGASCLLISREGKKEETSGPSEDPASSSSFSMTAGQLTSKKRHLLLYLLLLRYLQWQHALLPTMCMEGGLRAMAVSSDDCRTSAAALGGKVAVPRVWQRTYDTFHRRRSWHRLSAVLQHPPHLLLLFLPLFLFRFRLSKQGSALLFRDC